MPDKILNEDAQFETDQEFKPAAVVPKTVSEHKKANKPGPKPKRQMPWLEKYQFKKGQTCIFKSPGRPPKKLIADLILAELERVATGGTAKGKSKLEIMTERYVNAAAGLIPIKSTELQAMENLLMRFAGKGEAGKEEEKSKNQTVAVLVGRLNQNELLPPAPEPGPVIESEVIEEIPNE